MLKCRVWNTISNEFTWFDSPRFTLQDKPGVSQIDFANVQYNKIMFGGYCDIELWFGRKGEDDVDIYVGDIVECYYSENLKDDGLFTGEVVYDEERCRFKIKEIRPYKWGDTEIAGEIIYFEDAVDIRVIGHIHNTPVKKASESNDREA